jgi:hypothetical protein
VQERDFIGYIVSPSAKQLKKFILTNAGYYVFRN